MPRSRYRRPVALLARLALAGAAAAVLAPPALAQANTCHDFGKTLNERKDIVQRIGALGGKNKKVDAKTACAMFNTLVANGASAVKWLETNKDWCQVPDAFVENIKSDHARSVEMQDVSADVELCVQAMRDGVPRKRWVWGRWLPASLV